MGKGILLQVYVLERKDLQKPRRDVYLGLYPGDPIIRRGEEIAARDLKADDVVWYENEPFKVIWIRPWPPDDLKKREGKNESER